MKKNCDLLPFRFLLQYLICLETFSGCYRLFLHFYATDTSWKKVTLCCFSEWHFQPRRLWSEWTVLGSDGDISIAEPLSSASQQHNNPPVHRHHFLPSGPAFTFPLHKSEGWYMFFHLFDLDSSYLCLLYNHMPSWPERLCVVWGPGARLKSVLTDDKTQLSTCLHELLLNVVTWRERQKITRAQKPRNSSRGLWTLSAIFQRSFVLISHVNWAVKVRKTNTFLSLRLKKSSVELARMLQLNK